MAHHPSPVFGRWMASQKPRAQHLPKEAVFHRNLEEALDVRRRELGLITLMENTWGGPSASTVDFCSNDSLSLGSSGRLRREFERQLAQHPGLPLSAGGSRLLDGNYEYIEKAEEMIAAYHGVEAALVVGSGCDGNYAIFEAVPRPGNVIVHDELVHASIVDGMARSLASARLPFAHNDVDAFRDVLVSVWDSHPLVRQGKRCVLVAVETFYSMDGDQCPLRELVQVARDVFPAGIVQFVVDEAHSMGVVGERGLGFVHALGLDAEVAIKTHTFSKAFASIGGVILGNSTVKNTIVNFSRSFMFTTAPAFHQVAAIRAGYELMGQPETDASRDNIQRLVRRLLTKMTSHPVWTEANERKVLRVPVLAEGVDWASRELQTQIVPLCTGRERWARWVAFHLDARGYSAFAVVFPAVPRGAARLRGVVHADHTDEQVDGLVGAVLEWAEEMVGIERAAEAPGGKAGGNKIPWAAQRVYALGSGEDGVDVKC